MMLFKEQSPNNSLLNEYLPINNECHIKLTLYKLNKVIVIDDM